MTRETDVWITVNRYFKFGWDLSLPLFNISVGGKKRHIYISVSFFRLWNHKKEGHVWTHIINIRRFFTVHLLWLHLLISYRSGWEYIDGPPERDWTIEEAEELKKVVDDPERDIDKFLAEMQQKHIEEAG